MARSRGKGQVITSSAAASKAATAVGSEVKLEKLRAETPAVPAIPEAVGAIAKKNAKKKP